MAATGVATMVAGGLFGARSVEQLGVALIALAVIAVVVVRSGRHDVEVTRTISPERARPGQPVVLSLQVLNKGSGAVPMLLIEDRVPAGLTGSARFALRGVEPQGSREPAVTLTAERRGRYTVGPMELAIVDPFALAEVRSTALEAATFLVHPRIEALLLPRESGERRNASLATLRQPTGARGEDFYTLREYVEGDDLRKIHWPSTAKRGRYMIRQEETPWQTRATILLDDRDEVHEGFGELASFERAVEAAASLVDLYHRSGYSFRLAAAHHPGIATGKYADHRGRCLDLLATIATARRAGAGNAFAARVAEIESARTPEAALVVVSGTPSAADAVALTRCRRRFREVTLIAFPAHRFSGQTTKSRWAGESQVMEAARLLTRSGVRTLILGPDEALAAGWAGLSSFRATEATWGRRPELV